jgi:anti-sigma28 factor (negative regulator of flagellin synthesis)
MLELSATLADKPTEGDNKKSMKVTDSSSLANLGISGTSPAPRSVRPQAGAGSEAQTEVSLTAASQAVFSGRPERVAELRKLVSSGSYTPQTQQVGEKIVDQALSRPE